MNPVGRFREIFGRYPMATEDVESMVAAGEMRLREPHLSTAHHNVQSGSIPETIVKIGKGVWGILGPRLPRLPPGRIPPQLPPGGPGPVPAPRGGGRRWPIPVPIPLPGGWEEKKRYRRINPCNPKALTRALRRLVKFESFAKKVIRITRPPASARVKFKMKRKKRSS